MSSPLAHLTASPNLVDRAYHALLDAICDGSLAPGQRVTQEELAAQLAVSRQPVLQALRLLKAERFVLDAPGRGVLVAPLDARWIEQVYEVRSALDAQAARLAARHSAERCPVEPIDASSPRQRSVARPLPQARAASRPVIDPQLLLNGRQAARSGRIADMIDADLAFHTAVYVAADNPLLADMAQQHWRHIRRAMGAVLQSSALRETVWDEHAAIAAAIDRGDADEAAARMLGHGARASGHIAGRLLPSTPAGVAQPDSASSWTSTSRSTSDRQKPLRPEPQPALPGDLR